MVRYGLASFSLPAEAGEHLAVRAARRDGTCREVAARVPANSQIVFDDESPLHFVALVPEPEPVSLLELRVVLPRVDLPAVLPEMFAWTSVDQAFTSVTGGEARSTSCARTASRSATRTSPASPRSSGTTSACSAGTPSSYPTCSVGCGPCGTRPRPTKRSETCFLFPVSNPDLKQETPAQTQFCGEVSCSWTLY